MKFMIEYKGYIGHFFFDEKTNIFQGHVANIHVVITFQGTSVASTRKAFQDAVNEYIEWHKKYGKESNKTLP
jgi:predicted HicB family RNase H-like nuclease